MKEQDSLTSRLSYPDTRAYFQNDFFKKLQPFISARMAKYYDENENPRTDGLLPFPPIVETDEPRHYVVVKGVGARVFVRIMVEEDLKGMVLVTVASELRIRRSGIVGGIVLSLLTCGLWALVWIPILFRQQSKFRKYAAELVAVLKADLAS